MSTAIKEVVQQQYLTFFLAGEEYALSILKVKEIIEYDTVTKVPKTPSWVRGVINLRGSVVPVMDLAVKFGLKECQVTKTSCIIMVESELGERNTTIGLMADSVSQVVDLGASDIEEPPTFGTNVEVDYLIGMARMGKKFALLLDIDKVLSAEELLKVSGLDLGEEKGTEDHSAPGVAESDAM